MCGNFSKSKIIVIYHFLTGCGNFSKLEKYPYEICISKVNVGMYLLNSQEKNDDKVHFTN